MHLLELFQCFTVRRGRLLKIDNDNAINFIDDNNTFIELTKLTNSFEVQAKIN